MARAACKRSMECVAPQGPKPDEPLPEKGPIRFSAPPPVFQKQINHVEFFPMFSWLFPPTCVFCRNEVARKTVCCEFCRAELPWADSHASIFSPFTYQPPIDRSLLLLKFHRQLLYAHAFAQLFIEYIEKHRANPLPELLIPVPLHPKRLRQRGFNQALEIAKPIAKHFKIPLDFIACRRIKNTKPQSHLSAKQRARNVRRAFQIVRPIKATHIALIDDVVTTGNTINELERLFQKNGVSKIERWCVARGAPHNVSLNTGIPGLRPEARLHPGYGFATVFAERSGGTPSSIEHPQGEAETVQSEALHPPNARQGRRAGCI